MKPACTLTGKPQVIIRLKIGFNADKFPGPIQWKVAVFSTFENGSAFVNLIEGDYRLTIEAEGYERHQSQYRVVPGRVSPSIPIVLKSR